MKKLTITMILCVLGYGAYGQFGSWGDSGGGSGWGDTEETKKDTASSDSTVTEDAWGSSEGGEWGGSDDAWGSSGSSSTGGYGKQVAKKREFIKEEKVLLPYDTIRKLIIYKGIQELEDCEYCTDDSLYLRFKDWAKNEFGKKIFKDKKILNLDEQYAKINLILTLPLEVQSNKFTSYNKGNVQLNLTMWFQPYRYKYLFSNFVHEVPPIGTQTESQMVYFEYYQESKRNVQENNKYLKAVDDKVKKYIDAMKVALNDKPISLLDEDDW
jgi:hypothetical protein